MSHYLLFQASPLAMHTQTNPFLCVCGYPLSRMKEPCEKSLNNSSVENVTALFFPIRVLHVWVCMLKHLSYIKLVSATQPHCFNFHESMYVSKTIFIFASFSEHFLKTWWRVPRRLLAASMSPERSILHQPGRTGAAFSQSWMRMKSQVIMLFGYLHFYLFRVAGYLLLPPTFILFLLSREQYFLLLQAMTAFDWHICVRSFTFQIL